MCPSCSGQNVKSFDLTNPSLQFDGDLKPTQLYIRVRVHCCQDCLHSYFWKVDGDALIKRYEETINLDATVDRIGGLGINAPRTYIAAQDAGLSDEEVRRFKQACGEEAKTAYAVLEKALRTMRRSSKTGPG